MLKANCNSSSVTTALSGIPYSSMLKLEHLLGFPSASANEVLFLEKLLQFYSKSRLTQQANDVDDFMKDSETSEV